MQEINFFGQTDMGKLRTNNEDDLIFQSIWDENHVLGVAIDGVGGYEGGEVAAEIAKNTMVEYLEEYPNGERLVLLQEAVTAANNRIVEERQKQPKLSQMGCVLTAILVETEKRQINMVHIGDSRFYQFHNGTLTKLSHDHSYVGYREDINDLTEEEAMDHPKRNEISRLLGDQKHQSDDRDFIEAKTFPLLPDSILLLCSDGLTDLVTKAEITTILSQTTSLEEKVQALIDKANEKGGKDNITVVLIDYQNDEVDSVDNVNRVDLIGNEMKQKRKWLWSLLIAVLALLIGASGGWFARDYFPNDNKKSVPADTINEPDNTLKIDRNDTIQASEHEMEELRYEN